MNPRHEQLLEEADRCVKCGLCLAVCPTYQILANEAESPRGRISLLQGLWSGALTPDNAMEGHLRGCLQCLRCQNACPSGVDYRKLIEAGLADVPRRHAWLLRMLNQAPVRPWLLGLFGWWRRGRWFRPGLRLLPKAWRQLLGLFPRVAALPLATKPQPDGPTLFLGCVSRIVDNQAQLAFVRLCDALGLEVRLAEGQGCCGALHAHGGWPEQAQALAERNTRAFANSSQIISLASGCTAQLHRLHGDRVVDATSWLLEQPWPASVQVRPLEQRVAMHSPCSQGSKARQAVLELLHLIPRVQILSLGIGHGCCGGAGMALVEQPQLGQRLVSPLIDELRASGVGLVVTSNSGCALQLRRALAEAGLAIEVLHPLELLVRQL